MFRAGNIQNKPRNIQNTQGPLCQKDMGTNLRKLLLSKDGAIWKSVKTVTAMKWNVLKMLQSVSWKREREKGGKEGGKGRRKWKITNC